MQIYIMQHKIYSCIGILFVVGNFAVSKNGKVN